jgi:hypothetical protein
MFLDHFSTPALRSMPCLNSSCASNPFRFPSNKIFIYFTDQIRKISRSVLVLLYFRFLGWSVLIELLLSGNKRYSFALFSLPWVVSSNRIVVIWK